MNVNNESEVVFIMQTGLKGLCDTTTLLALTDRMKDGETIRVPVEFKISGWTIDYKDGMSRFTFNVYPMENLKMDDLIRVNNK